LKGVDQESKEGFAEVGHIKAEHFRAAIAAAANDTPSAAETSYNYLGGSLYNTAKNLEAAGSAGNEYVKQFNDSYDEARSKGSDIWNSIKSAASQSYPGFKQATQSWADQRVNQVANQLTPSQQAYYRAAMFEAFAGIDIGGSDRGALDSLKQRLIDEEGNVDGNNIAKLLSSAVGQNRMDLVNQIGNYNRALGKINY